MIAKEYRYLPEGAKKIRNQVFIIEQGFIEEFDDIDNIATHLVMYEMENLVSTCRNYFNNFKQAFVIGRSAVIKDYRGQKIGARMLN